MVQKVTLRRFVFGIIWFMVFSYGLSIGGAIMAVSALGEGASTAAQLAAQRHFAQTFGPYIFFGSLIVATIGTVMGFLPGTKKS